MFSNWAAVFVTLVSPCISTILLEAVHKVFGAGSQLASTYIASLSNQNRRNVDAAIPLEDRFASANTGPQTTYEHFQRQLNHIECQHGALQGTWTLFLGLVRSVRLPANGRTLPSLRVHDNLREILAFTFLTSFLFSAFVGMIAASIFTAGILTGSLALSDSPNCGIWRLDLSSGMPDDHTSDLYLHEWPLRRAVESTVDYRRACLNRQSSSPECGSYAIQLERYETRSNASCPFQDWRTCLQGPTGSYTLETPMMDSMILGINAPIDQRYHFRRKMTCSPVSNDDRYIRNNGEMWQYFYGQARDGGEISIGYGVGTSFRRIEETAGDSLRGKFRTECALSHHCLERQIC